MPRKKSATSAAAHSHVLRHGYVNARSHQLLMALSQKPQTREELVASTKIPYGTVNARCNEMVCFGVLRESGTRKTKTGGQAHVLHIRADAPAAVPKLVATEASTRTKMDWYTEAKRLERENLRLTAANKRLQSRINNIKRSAR